MRENASYDPFYSNLLPKPLLKLADYNCRMNFEATQTVTETHVQTNIRFDPWYIKSIPGALKLGAVVSRGTMSK